MPELDRGYLDCLADGNPSLAVARDHAYFQGQEFVEAEPAQRRVAGGERLRVVGVLQSLRDRHRALRGRTVRNRLVFAVGDRRPCLSRQVLRVCHADFVERLPDRPPKSRRGQPDREPIHRHDPSGVEQR